MSNSRSTATGRNTTRTDSKTPPPALLALTASTPVTTSSSTTASHDLATVDTSKVRTDPTLVFAGPPCQGFSSAGGGTNTDDPRNALANATIDWINELQPKLAVIENVVGLRDVHQGRHRELETAFTDAGYNVATVVLNTATYGIPQTRERVFILGVRDDLEPPNRWEPPQKRAVEPMKTLDGQTLDGYASASDALADLPDPLPPQKPAEDSVHMVSQYDSNRVTPHACGEWMDIDGEETLMPPNHVAADHSASARQRMATMPHGHSGTSVTERRLHPDKPAPTMTVSSGTPPVHYTGPTPPYRDQTPQDPAVRRMTVREVARIQTFPDWFCFAGTKAEQFRQAGNAVPPHLAAHITSHLGNTVLFGEN